MSRPSIGNRGSPPASWKYGVGWEGGTPTQREVRQTHIVSGGAAWHIDGDGQPVPVPPELAELYQLDLWLNPHGFIKAARLPGADPVAFWRWEQIEKGRDGNVVRPEKMHVVAITMFGRYRVDATINSDNQIQRIKTTVNVPALGDFNIEHESTEQLSFGDVKWPVAWHSHHGWDDNWQFYRQSTGHNGYGGRFPDVRAERLPRTRSHTRDGAGCDVRNRRSSSPNWRAASTSWAGVRSTATWWSSTSSSLYSRRQAMRSEASRSSRRSCGWHPTNPSAG